MYLVDPLLDVGYLAGVTLLLIELTSVLKQLYRVVKASYVAVNPYEVGQLCGDGSVLVLSADILLGEKNRS